nr:MAG TPA: hypothetical protein [Caudoviricetes sp.]
MEYLEIKDNIIIGHYCGAMPKQKDPVIEYRIIENCVANIGDDIRMYTDLQSGTKKPLTQLVAENLISVPEGKKLNEAGAGFEDMTEAEKVAAGLIQLKADEKIEGDYIVKKSKKELYDEGKLSKEAYNCYIDGLRQAAYSRESDPLGMQVLRGELEKSEWLTKIDEIKKRFPKVE